MKNRVNKIIAPGVISVLFFSGFLSFVYNAESAKYEEKKTAEPSKEYDETVITQVNTEVAKAMQELASAGYPSPDQPQEYTPTETIETIVYEDVESQTEPTASPETYIATSIPRSLQIPSITIPSIPVPTNIPNITPIAPVAIPKIPSPQPTPTIQPAPIAPAQPKPAAPQPRTTVS